MKKTKNMGLYITLVTLLIIPIVAEEHCLRIKNCLCSDNGDKCLSPGNTPKSLLGSFSFDHHTKSDDLGLMEINPMPVAGPGYRPGTFSLHVTSLQTYTISGDAVEDPDLKHMSLSFWVFQISRSEHTFASILEKGGKRNENTPSISISPSDNSIEVLLSTKKHKVSLSSKGAILPRKWAQICLVISKKSLAIYLNGRLDSNHLVEEEIKFNTGRFKIGASGERIGLEMFFDNFKIWNKALNEIEVMEHFGGHGELGQNSIGKVQLGCLDCNFEEAFRGCSADYHLCSQQEILAGGYQTAYNNGWLRVHQSLWSLQPQHLSQQQEGQKDKSIKKAAVCCRNREDI